MTDLIMAEADKCPVCNHIIYGDDCVFCKGKAAKKPSRKEKIKDMDMGKFLEFAVLYWQGNQSITFKQFCEGLKDYKEVI